MRGMGCTMYQELDRALPQPPQQICEEGGGKGWTGPFSFLYKTLTQGLPELVVLLSREPHPWGTLCYETAMRGVHHPPAPGMEGYDEVQVQVCWATRNSEVP